MSLNFPSPPMRFFTAQRFLPSVPILPPPPIQYSPLAPPSVPLPPPIYSPILNYLDTLPRDVLIELITKLPTREKGRILSASQSLNRLSQFPGVRGSMLENLPNDVLFQILDKLSDHELARILSTSKLIDYNMRKYFENRIEPPKKIFTANSQFLTPQVRRFYGPSSSFSPSVINPLSVRKWPGQVLQFPPDDLNPTYLVCTDPDYPYPYYKTNPLANRNKYPCIPLCGKIDRIGQGTLYNNCDPRSPTQ